MLCQLYDMIIQSKHGKNRHTLQNMGIKWLNVYTPPHYNECVRRFSRHSDSEEDLLIVTITLNTVLLHGSSGNFLHIRQKDMKKMSCIACPRKIS